MVEKRKLKPASLVIHVGSDPGKQSGGVNPPVYRASTIITPDVKTLLQMQERQYQRNQVYYGAYGGGSTMPLCDAIAALEEGYGTVLFSTGLSAVTLPLMAWLKSGDHVLLTDGIYGSSRIFCNSVLKRFGVEVEFYDPLIGADIARLMRPNTRIVHLESPSSLKFDVQDVPAICKVAHQHGALTLLDNTWGGPVFFPAFRHGVDVSIMAVTKYIGGHSDLVMGSATVKSAELFSQLKKCAMDFGDVPGADDCYLALRGVRTLKVRMQHQQESALKIAKWLQQQPQVKRVLYPALPEDAGHAIWKRDFLGASSLFGVWLNSNDVNAVENMLKSYQLFRIGLSWGGFESLSFPSYCQGANDSPRNEKDCLLIRYHVGLEDVDDLIEDLKQGFSHI